MIRSVLAVVTGFVVFVMLGVALWAGFGYGARDLPTRDFLLFSLVCEIAFAVAAGYLSAWIARRREATHGAVLAGVMALQGLASVVFAPAGYPLWVPLSTIVVLAPACYLGARLRERHARAPAHEVTRKGHHTGERGAA